MSKEQTIAELAKSLKEAGLSAEQITQILVSKASAGATRVVNTKETLSAPNINIGQILANARNKFKGEKLVKVSIARPYGKLTGGYIKLGINGVAIELPADGNEYSVPASFAIELKRRLHNLDVIDSDAGPTIGNQQVSSWASEGGLGSGNKTIDQVSYK